MTECGDVKDRALEAAKDAVSVARALDPAGNLLYDPGDAAMLVRAIILKELEK